MSSLLKSKFLLGILVVAALVIGAFASMTYVAFAAPASTSVDEEEEEEGGEECEITKTLKRGSKGDEVKCLQSILGVKVDGVFGPKTEAAVKEWQEDNDVKVTGVFGKLSRAALAASMEDEVVVTTPVTPATPEPVSGLPAGCTSTSGFSPTTGTKCDSVTTLPAGCASTSGYSPTTGTKCDSVVTSTVPAGCTSTSGYSPTTGVKCDTVVAAPTATEGTLVNFAKLGAYSTTKVDEGQTDIKVFGIEFRALDADQKIDSFKVSFTGAGGGSKKLDRYISDVSVWLDGVEVGRKPASAFTEETTDEFATLFSGMKGVVKAGSKANLVVAISAVGTIDTANITTDWTVTGGTTSVTGNYVTAVSPNGRYRDYGSAASAVIDFQKAGTNVEYNVSGSSTAQVIEVDDVNDTLNKTLLTFEVEARNGALKLQKLPVTLTASAAVGGDAVVPNVEALIKKVSLYAGGTLLESSSSVPSGAGPIVVTFGNVTKLNYSLSAGSKVKFEVKVDFNDIDNTGAIATDFDEADLLKADYTDLANTTVELSNGDAPSVKSGGLLGQNQELRSVGLNVDTKPTLVIASSSTEQSTGKITSATLNVTFKVKALGKDMYIGKRSDSGTLDMTLLNNTMDGVGILIEKSDGTALTGATTPTLASVYPTASVFMSSTADLIVNGTTESFKIPVDQTRDFTSQIILVGDTALAANNKLLKIQLDKIQGFTDSALTPANVITQTLNPSTSYETLSFTLSTQ